MFGGAGSVLYQKEPSKIEVFNDINDEIINLHLCIKKCPQTLSMYLNQLLISRNLFYKIKTKKLKPKNKIEAATF